MPILSNTKVRVLAPEVDFDRLAFRASLTAHIEQGEPTPDSGMSLVATRYRKPADGEFETCGLVGVGEVGAQIGASSPPDAMLIRDVSLACLDYAGVKGDAAVTLNFSWRPEAGDLVGMAMLSVTPVGGEEITRSSGDTNRLAAEDPAFAATFGRVFAAIDVWCQARGW